MEEQLKILEQLLNLNRVEGYLYIDLNAEGFKLMVIERGTGGCTFPDMEILTESNLTDHKEITLYLQDPAIFKKLEKAKGNIKNTNPHFYDTVFLQ